MTSRSVIRGFRWYLREISGEASYDRYAEHARRQHSGAPVLTRREFERRRMAERDANPQARCC